MTVNFHSVKNEKISGLIARQIKGAILTGKMKPGDKLPSERELVQRFQASRISVREALKNLETSGLLRTRPGSGAFVAEISSRPMSEFFSSILKIKKTSIDLLTEARVILEPTVARLASERIEPEELLKLEQNIEEASKIIERNSSAFVVNIEFHSVIAEATHNPVITFTMKNLLDVVKEMTSEKMDKLIWRIETSKHAISYHKKILDALKQKNPQKVYELMMNHIIRIQEDDSRMLRIRKI